ncbi:MAG: efflux RND transporter periplasmic adaptor subunit [Candidatus Hydrogenedentes bacterium]|nr:efflux RND transporter periplasmic adaptor subunit [Candidatus Hydrogenedentota bacterium]
MSNSSLDSQLGKLHIDKSRKRVRRSRGRWLWLFAAVAVALACWGTYQAAFAPIPVQTARVEVESAEAGRGPALVTASGYVVPRRKVEVSSKIMGRVVEVNVRRGDIVNEGDVVMRIEDADFQARVLSSEAQVASLRARLAELKAGSRPQEITAADAALASAEATLRNAEVKLRRQEALAQRGAVAKEDLDLARTAYDVAKAEVDTNRSNAQLVRIGPRQEQIQAAEAQLRVAEANLELARTELEYTVIRAPITGTVLEKLAEQGELVTNTNFGGTRGAKSSVLSMADLGDLQVEVDLNEIELPKVKLGQKVEIRLDFSPERAYAGEVDEIAPQADRQKGTIQVKARVIAPDELVVPEVNARVTFLGAAMPAASSEPGRRRLWIPRSAIYESDGDPAVYCIEGGKAVSRRVTAGVEGERGIEVLEGLSGDETLVANPPESLRDGSTVIAAQ